MSYEIGEMDRFCAVSRLSDAELVGRLAALVERDHRLTAALLVHIGEVDARRLYARHARSSLFQYCVTVLGFSEDVAYKRVAAARLARRYPVVLELVQSGKLHLSGLLLVAPHLTEAGHRELLAAACGKSKREVEKLVAERFPKPDVPTTVRKLPERRACAGATLQPEAEATGAASESVGAPGTEGAAGAPAARWAEGGAAAARCAVGASVGVQPLGATSERSAAGAAGVVADGQAGARVAGVVADRVAAEAANRVGATDTGGSGALAPTSAVAERVAPGVSSELRPVHDRARVEPLAPARYRVTFTAGEAFCQKLEHARALASHAVAPSELARLLERALDALIEREEKRRCAVGARARVARGTEKTVPATRREPCTEQDPGRVRDAGGVARTPLETALDRDVSGASEARRSSDTSGAGKAAEPSGSAEPRQSLEATKSFEPCGWTEPGKSTEPREIIEPSELWAAGGAASMGSRRHPARVRRAVWERDGGRCTFVDASGRGCTERRFLELEHVLPYAFGGPATEGNTVLLCRAHNALAARVVFGDQRVDGAIARSRARGRDRGAR
jgi:hypothetical protein